MEQDSQYIIYLQKILENNGLTYLSDHQFKQKKGHVKQMVNNSVQTELNTLETNIKEPLTKELIQRYSRQMLLKEISYEGQCKIVTAKVALIGSGGIGCPLALYLGAAGVGTLGLFDSDTVDPTNLHRQVGHTTSRIGMEKTESLKRSVLSINPHIKINKHPFITAENANILDQYDWVIDGSDNPKCRYIVNDYCMKRGKRLLSGACIGWEAQITCYGGNNLCYRCLWGNDQVSMGGCSTLGVIGMLPGLVGIILATEALKLIVNGQSSLEGKLLTFEGRSCQFKKMSLRKKKPDCLACGLDRLNIQTYNYDKYTLCVQGIAPQAKQMNWQTYLSNFKAIKPILDVRPSSLFNVVHFNNSINIPLEELRKKDKKYILDLFKSTGQDQSIPVSCLRGVSSRHAVQYLSQLGIKAFSLTGGIRTYATVCDPSVPQI